MVKLSLRHFQWLLFGCLLLLLAQTQAHAQEAGLDLDRIKRATVYIIQTQNIGGRPVITCAGSGTIVNRSGLIATNAHHTVTNRDCPGDQLIVALSIRTDEPPVPTYFAEIAQADVGLDLALLRITQELSGRLVEPDALALPFVEIGDSTQTFLDQTITVVGYPSIQGEAVASVRGTLSGFVAEPSGGERAWLKTDATIPGLMTGGGVYNQDGQLIGIPTTLPVTPLSEEINCVALEDTNGDDLINALDRCVPIGGFINALRPSTFVRPLLRAAALGVQLEMMQSSALQFGTSGQPEISNLFIASAVNEGMPTAIVGQLPAGTTSVYLFFDYRNMTPETIYELRVTIDDIPNATFSLAPVRWSGGTNGLWYIGGVGQVWPPGIYEFTVFIDGLPAGSQTISIGAGADTGPSFRNIFFCIEEGDNCYGDVYILPTGTIVRARFIHQNIAPGTSWTQIWYYNDLEINRITEEWEDPGRDTKTVRIETDQPLLPGRYRLDLYLQGRLAARSDFVIAGASEGAFARIFSNSRFITAETASTAIDPVDDTSITNFPTGVQELYAVFNWEQIAPGTLWTLRWLVDNEVFYEQTMPWTLQENGQNFLIRLSGTDGIPDGSYRMELVMNGLIRRTVETEVGIGQLPIDQFAQTVGVQLNGQIIDAETREGIPGVTVVLLTEDYSVADFEWNQSQVYALATTDRNGNFQFDRLLEYEVAYSALIEAVGYLPITADGVEVDAETENPLNISIPLTRG